MKLTLHSQADIYLVKSYTPGKLELRDRSLTTPVLLSPTQIVSPWDVGEIGDLDVNVLAPLLAWEPDICVLGTGEKQHFPPPRLTADLAARGIGLEVMGTAAACRTYNVLAVDGRRVAGALIL